MGGADFGAGIIELFSTKKNKDYTRKTMYRAIGPIWEANHMWLIITIVILFVGFPDIYTTMSTYLHIPLLIMLMGIIARGTAFTFRNYDAVKDDMQKVYNKIFVYSSFITPFFLGIIAASAVSGKIDLHARTFLDAYIFSWLSFFSLSVGLFTVTICGYLASIFIIGETTEEKDHIRFRRKAAQMTIGAILSGLLVFIAAYYDHIPVFDWILGNAIGIIGMSAAAFSLVALWILLYRDKTKPIRFLAGFQVTMILLIVTVKHYPNIVILKGGDTLSLQHNAAIDKTIFALGMALLLGSLFILPALGYLLYSFNKNEEAHE
jgi:cytochrome d ubiquinol oxidase subunit II